MEKMRTNTAAITRNATDADRLQVTGTGLHRMMGQWVTGHRHLWMAMADHRRLLTDAALRHRRAGALSRAVTEDRY